MNRKCLIILISALFVMMSSTSFASIFDDMQLGPKIGLHWPIGDYGDIADLGLTVGGQLKAPVNEKWNWGVNLTYASSSGDESAAVDISSDFDITMFELYPFVDYYIVKDKQVKDSQMDFFLRGGLGLNFWEVDVDIVELGNGALSRSEDDMDLMIALGGGVNFLGDFEALVLYNRILTMDLEGDKEPNEYFTFTIGYNFDIRVGE